MTFQEALNNYHQTQIYKAVLGVVILLWYAIWRLAKRLMS